jgi:hypothetical protein
LAFVLAWLGLWLVLLSSLATIQDQTQGKAMLPPTAMSASCVLCLLLYFILFELPEKEQEKEPFILFYPIQGRYQK